MGQGLGAIVVRSTTLDELFDVVSIDLGSGRDSDHTDITVTAVDASGSAIISKEFFNQYELAAHGLTGFVRMASLEITAVKPGSTTRVTFSFDDIHIVPSILAPTYSCLGFDSPMANGAVKVKKNRALPHKAELVDADGFPITDLDIAAPPVIMVTYYSNETGAAEETLEALSLGNATEGNQFVLSDADEWQFNLSTKSYSSVGTYYTKMVSGDASEYLISPNCEGSFEIK